MKDIVKLHSVRLLKGTITIIMFMCLFITVLTPYSKIESPGMGIRLLAWGAIAIMFYIAGLIIEKLNKIMGK